MNKETTPGPWYPVDYAGYINLQTHDSYDPPSNVLDAEIDPNYEANGIMAAAAPDMHEALRLVICDSSAGSLSPATQKAVGDAFRKSKKGYNPTETEKTQRY